MGWMRLQELDGRKYLNDFTISIERGDQWALTFLGDKLILDAP